MTFEVSSYTVLSISNDGKARAFVEARSLPTAEKLRFGYVRKPEPNPLPGWGLTRPWGSTRAAQA